MYVQIHIFVYLYVHMEARGQLLVSTLHLVFEIALDSVYLICVKNQINRKIKIT